MREAVVLIHGIWMTGIEMWPLGQRIREAGFAVHYFHYHSLLRSPAENAERLNAWLQTLDAEVIHLVAHSLGGIVVAHLFDRCPTQKPGRVIMLGTPLRGSAVAHAYHRSWITRPLLGKSVMQGLMGDGPRWNRNRQLCMIAGNRGVGIGTLLFGKLPSPNDGTVAVEETRDPALNQHLEVPYSHFGMLFARPVAEEVVSCLEKGVFRS
jgi:pimeloyl-ACP methyl ester carboxylesterase